MRFIGFYDYTVILTYLSLISSVFGMTQAIHGDYKEAIFCLALSGACDAFDGRVARTKKNRTEDEKNFGIQLDSLCDVICFGVFPAMICYLLGVRGAIGLPIVFFYCLCAVIRLAFFNVLEANRQKTEGGSNKVYRGFRLFYKIASVACCLALIAMLLAAVSYLPPVGGANNPASNEVVEKYIEDGLQDTGAVNIVTGMILDYRAFDTFGESNVLFIATCTVLILLRSDKKKDKRKAAAEANRERFYEPKDDSILQRITFLLFIFVLYFLLCHFH